MAIFNLPSENAPSSGLPSAKWSDLPAEIKANILERLVEEPEALKACRLLDKSTSKEASRLLFQRLHFWPSMTCLGRLSKIAHPPALVNLVRVLHCHRCPLKELELRDMLSSECGAERLRPLYFTPASSISGQLRGAYEMQIIAEEEFGGLGGHGAKGLAFLMGKLPDLDTLIYDDGSMQSSDSEYLTNSGTALSQRTGATVLERSSVEGTLSLFNIRYALARSRQALSLTSLEFLCGFEELCSLVPLCLAMAPDKMRRLRLIFEVPQIFIASAWHIGILSSPGNELSRVALHLSSLRKLCFGFDNTGCRPLSMSRARGSSHE